MNWQQIIDPAGPFRQRARSVLLMLGGSLLVAVAVNGILIPHRYLSGGFTGLSILLHYVFPMASVSLIYLLVNLPLFALGWRMVNRRFFFLSLTGMALMTLAIQFVHVSLPVQDPVPAALLAGILAGAGSGLMLRSRGSAGGSDILSVVMFRKFSLRLGTTYLAMDALVLTTGTLLFPLDRTLYTLLFLFVNAQVINLVVTGLSKRKAVFIFSHNPEIVQEDLLKRTTGVTLIPAVGGYSKEARHIIYTVVTFRELGRLKEVVRELDPEAIVVVSDTLEVMGQRIGNEPKW